MRECIKIYEKNNHNLMGQFFKNLKNDYQANVLVNMGKIAENLHFFNA